MVNDFELPNNFFPCKRVWKIASFTLTACETIHQMGDQ